MVALKLKFLDASSQTQRETERDRERLTPSDGFSESNFMTFHWLDKDAKVETGFLKKSKLRKAKGR